MYIFSVYIHFLSLYIYIRCLKYRKCGNGLSPTERHTHSRAGAALSMRTFLTRFFFPQVKNGGRLAPGRCRLRLSNFERYTQLLKVYQHFMADTGKVTKRFFTDGIGVMRV